MGKVEKARNPERIRMLIRLGQAINKQRWQMGLDDYVQEILKRYNIRKEDIGSRIDKH